MLELSTTENNDLILDFFAGSGTTAQSVLELNQLDKGKRKCMLVQLPEKTDNPQYPTIADIARERIRRVIQKIQGQADLASPAPENLGFKSFVLAPSNFKQWRGDDIETAEQLAKQIEMFVQSEKDGADVADLLYELLLKAGHPLTAPLERLDIEGGPVWRVNGGELLIMLESFSFAMIEPLLALGPKEILCLDSVFRGSDELKANLDLQCRDARIRFTCV
jgi:adenine-specific DNA-methyltransferase